MIGQKQNFLGAKWNGPADSFLKVLRVVWSFSFLPRVRKVENESFPFTHNQLVNEPHRYGETIAVVYQHTKRTEEMLFADWEQ